VVSQVPQTVLKPLTESATDLARWDAFVTANPDGTFFHRAGWRSVIEQAFHHRTRYVYTQRGSQITGVLPLVHVSSRLFGRSLISNPFCVRGGPLVTDRESLELLRQYASDEMERLAVDRLEFRLDRPSGAPGWISQSDLYATFRRKITAQDDQNLNAVPRKQRAVIRKSLASTLVVSDEQHVPRFYRIYAESLRNLGTPAFPQRYFQLLLNEFTGCSEITTVVDGDRPLASVLSFFFRDEVLPYYAGGTPIARARGAYDLLYWEVMRRAAARGCSVFDFGRSKVGTGSYAFKKNWGFSAQPLTYEFRIRDGAKPPDLNPLNPKYRPYIALWKWLPLPVANFIGPHLVRSLG
jgi:FemAB-related protein (PEP-CTERM system-associated)